MPATARIERALTLSLGFAEAVGSPPRLAQAMNYAVFPRGARIRPRLCLAVAHACGDDAPELTDAAAAAIEFLHCASLVHDDLPCFDDAAERRGKPSVHRAFGEPLAVLAGDGLIVLAFQTLARAAIVAPLRLGAVMGTVANGVGAPFGIVAGQAWECEPQADLVDYQRAKTGALFAAAAGAGAAAAGADPECWRSLGELLGEAYQVADDLADAVGTDDDRIGKPKGQDAAHGRPNAALTLGIPGAVRRLRDLATSAVASIPPCRGEEDLKALILHEAMRLLPQSLAQTAV